MRGVFLLKLCYILLKILDSIKSASKYGVSAESPSFDLSKIMSRKDKTVKNVDGRCEDDCEFLRSDYYRKGSSDRRRERGGKYKSLVTEKPIP